MSVSPVEYLKEAKVTHLILNSRTTRIPGKLGQMVTLGKVDMVYRSMELQSEEEMEINSIIR